MRIFDDLRAEEGKKELKFEKGTYFITSDFATKKHLNITNTIGEKEWEKGEEKHLQNVAMYLENIKNLTIDFAESTLILYGVFTNIAIINSQNITIKNVQIRTDNPNLHEIKVVNKTAFYVDFAIDNESKYQKIGKSFSFVGKDYSLPFKYKLTKTWWIGDIKEETPDKIKRTFHPFLSSYKIKEIEPHKIRVYYFSTARFKMGERFYLYDVRRKNVGIFADNSSDIMLQNIKQTFNYSLAVVCEHCNNITIDSVDFSPENDRKMCSIADFIQICMCSGDVVVQNSNFEGAGDDCMNVHGFHFAVVNKEDNKIVVRFMHPQSYGFLPFDNGDKLAYIDKNSLVEKGGAVVKSAKMLNEYDIELAIDGVLPEDNCVVENVTKTPNLYFINNRLNRIITRGILVTTRGKVVIKDNVFNNNSMSGILISDDASAWYESGMVKDVLITGNTFNNSEEYDILIKPENKCFEGYVHNNIVIENNNFASKTGGGIFVKDSKITLKNNTICEKDYKLINKNSQILEK